MKKTPAGIVRGAVFLLETMVVFFEKKKTKYRYCCLSSPFTCRNITLAAFKAAHYKLGGLFCPPAKGVRRNCAKQTWAQFFFYCAQGLAWRCSGIVGKFPYISMRY